MSRCVWSTTPKARKQHACSNCNRVIDRGEGYSRNRAISIDGDLYTWKECVHCEAFCGLYLDDIWYDDDYGYGPDDIREWEPVTAEAVEHKRQWLNRWRDETGSLYPIPAGATRRVIEDRRPNEAYL